MFSSSIGNTSSVRLRTASESGLNGVETADGRVTMKDFLEHLAIADQLFLARDEGGDGLLCCDLIRMGRSNQIHRHIRIDEDHDVSSE